MIRRSLVLTTLLLLGCPNLGPIDFSSVTPKVSLRNVKLNNVDFEGATADFKFAVSNPNPINIKLSTFAYDLKLVESTLIFSVFRHLCRTGK